jgi:esterase
MKLHVSRAGQGRPLVLLHGLFGCSNNWAPLVAGLKSHFDLITPDLRNHGKSPHDPDASVRAMSEDLAELLDSLGLGRVLLLGHSLGGRVAMRFALDHGPRVERLLIAEMGPREYGPLFPQVFEALTKLPIQNIRNRKEADEQLSSSLPDSALRAFLLTNLHRVEDSRYRWKMNLEALQAARADTRAEIKAPAPYGGPVLFLRGENSVYLKDADLPGIKALFPGATLETLPGAGHWLHVDKPLEFKDKISKFFQIELR